MKKLATRQATIDQLRNRFIVGTQFYRPPTPRPEEWEPRLDKAVELGFDHIRLWALWNYLEPRPGEFQFDAYDRLVDLAAERDLGVCINFIFDHVPIWAARRHDAFLRDIQGNPERTDLLFGGHFACWDNPGLRQQATPLIRTMVERYGKREALVLWDVWNEVKYYRCWCAHSTAAYAAWLRERFDSLAALNAYAATTYGDWDEIYLPANAKDICQDLLANQFVREQLNRQMRWVHDEIRSVDPLTPIMTHSHSWGSVTKGLPMWDDWTVREQVDLWGASQHIIYYQSQNLAPNRFAYTVANLESKRASGHYWLSEMASGILRGGHLGMRQRVGENETTFNLWTFIAHGAKGITFWQLQPERYSAEAPGWGLLGMDGSETYTTAEVRRFQKVLAQHHDFLIAAQPPREKVGVFYHPDSSVLHTIMNRSDHTRLFHGIVYTLWSHSIHFRILREWDDFSQYETIFFPGALTLSDELLAKILAYIKGGGTVIAEAGFGSYAPNGMYRTHVPGDALHERFGYHEVDILPLFDKEVTVELEATGLDLENPQRRIPMQAGPHTLLGSYDYRRVIVHDGTQVKGLYPDGRPAILERRIGDGRFVYFGSAIGPHLLESNDPVHATKLLDVLGLAPDIAFTATGMVTARYLQHDGQRWILFFNQEWRPAHVLWPEADAATPIFESTPTWPAFTLEAKGTKILRLND